MAKIYFTNYGLELAKAKIFNSIHSNNYLYIFDVLELSSGDYLPKTKMESGNYVVYGGGGITNATHNEYNVENRTLGIGRVGARCGCCFIIEAKSWVTDNALFVSKLKKKYDYSFLMHYLNHLNLNKFANQSAQPVISQRGISKCTIPDIDFDEQKRIAETLDAIENGNEFDDIYELSSVLKVEKKLAVLQDELTQQQTYLSQLRQSILQHAVQGKLTQQNPTDEPASKLLERIKAEKQQLIAAGKLKKEKEFPPISVEEIPFELPKGWVWCRLGEVGITQTGATPPTNKKEYFGDDIPFIGPGDMNDGKINYNNNGLSKLGIEKGRLILKNSILMVCIGGSIGKALVIDRDVTCNQQINTITCYPEISTDYIFIVLTSPYFQTKVLEKATGSATPIINKGKWESILIPVPSSSEQHYIVTKVQQLMQMVNQLEQQVQQSQTQAQQLLQAVLKEAFSLSAEASAKDGSKQVSDTYTENELATMAAEE